MQHLLYVPVRTFPELRAAGGFDDLELGPYSHPANGSAFIIRVARWNFMPARPSSKQDLFGVAARRRLGGRTVRVIRPMCSVRSLKLGVPVSHHSQRPLRLGLRLFPRLVGWRRLVRMLDGARDVVD